MTDERRELLTQVCELMLYRVADESTARAVVRLVLDAAVLEILNAWPSRTFGTIQAAEDHILGSQEIVVDSIIRAIKRLIPQAPTEGGE